MIIVTGGAGFIGSNLIKRLNDRGQDNILLIDDLTDGHKFQNLRDLAISDFIDKDVFANQFRDDRFSMSEIDCVFHLGACSDTTEWNGKYMMDANYAYSRDLLHFCQRLEIPFVYASSAAVYGGASAFVEEAKNEIPLNVYGYSKLLFDRYVRNLIENRTAQVVGLRYFNVYGPREQHKGKMASVAYHFDKQISAEAQVKLFRGSHGYADGEQLRDFIFVEDAVDVTLWFADHPHQSGIFNCGTGRAQSFNDVANAVIEHRGGGNIDYIPFPDGLESAYQSYTQADLSALRNVGYENEFADVKQGVTRYLDWLHEH